jgi:hypothetical protein
MSGLFDKRVHMHRLRVEGNVTVDARATMSFVSISNIAVDGRPLVNDMGLMTNDE